MRPHGSANADPLSILSGGSKGGGGARDARPPGSPNSFNFMQFLGKFGKFLCWRPLLGEILDPPLILETSGSTA